MNTTMLLGDALIFQAKSIRYPHLILQQTLIRKLKKKKKENQKTGTMSMWAKKVSLINMTYLRL